jgi:hypothetical protein
VPVFEASETPVPPELLEVAFPKLKLDPAGAFWTTIPAVVGFVLVVVVAVTAPLKLSRNTPCAELFVEERVPSVIVPPELVRFSAGPPVAVTFASLIVSPVAPVPVIPAPAPAATFKPRTWSLAATPTVPWTVGRVPLIDGLATVPAGGLIPKAVSKSAPVTPWPISRSAEPSVIPLVAVPV